MTESRRKFLAGIGALSLGGAGFLYSRHESDTESPEQDSLPLTQTPTQIPTTTPTPEPLEIISGYKIQGRTLSVSLSDTSDAAEIVFRAPYNDESIHRSVDNSTTVVERTLISETLGYDPDGVVIDAVSSDGEVIDSMEAEITPELRIQSHGQSGDSYEVTVENQGGGPAFWEGLRIEGGTIALPSQEVTFDSPVLLTHTDRVTKSIPPLWINKEVHENLCRGYENQVIFDVVYSTYGPAYKNPRVEYQVEFHVQKLVYQGDQVTHGTDQNLYYCSNTDGSDFY